VTKTKASRLRGGPQLSIYGSVIRLLSWRLEEARGNGEVECTVCMTVDLVPINVIIIISLTNRPGMKLGSFKDDLYSTHLRFSLGSPIK
jgi:hypothetical protein